MIIGARQTGKTYIINEFCKNNFDDYLHIIMDKDEDVCKIFEETIDPNKIIEK